MHALFEQLLSGGPAATDGSWGTQMQVRGLKRGESPDSWCLTNPDLVEEVARQYVTAGSQIILTNTFGANRYVLANMGHAQNVAAINKAGVEISKKAAAGKSKVFASMGPTGKMLAMGDVTEEDLRQAFEEQAGAIAEGGPDAIVVETMMDLVEAKIALIAAKATGLPVVTSMVFDSGKNKDRTLMGVAPEQAAEELAAAGADAIGANCGQGIEGFIPICRRMKEVSGLPIWMKPNAGIPELINGEAVYTTTPEEFGQSVPELINAGASFIGACCGSNGDFITEIRERIRKEC